RPDRRPGTGLVLPGPAPGRARCDPRPGRVGAGQGTCDRDAQLRAAQGHAVAAPGWVAHKRSAWRKGGANHGQKRPVGPLLRSKASTGPRTRCRGYPQPALGLGTTIWLDDNAAGWGWFVDPTPRDDSEFTTPGDQGEQGRMDLLTVLMHAAGHFRGHDHHVDGLMAQTLTAGTRREPGHDAPLADWTVLLSSINVPADA